MKSSSSLLTECIIGWLESNPYLIAGYEIRAVNDQRFDISDRRLQHSQLHIVIDYPQIAVWTSNGGEFAHWNNTSLVAIGHIDNCVEFDIIIDNLHTRLPRMMEAANPKFFDWMRDWIRLIISTQIDKTYGLD